jgi:hypothetical protein
MQNNAIPVFATESVGRTPYVQWQDRWEHGDASRVEKEGFRRGLSRRWSQTSYSVRRSASWGRHSLSFTGTTNSNASGVSPDWQYREKVKRVWKRRDWSEELGENDIIGGDGFAEE